jgi:threonyl-tRNA synthetase
MQYFSNILINLEFQASSAYWRGNKDRESLQRVYGISYPDQKRLKVNFNFWPHHKCGFIFLSKKNKK